MFSFEKLDVYQCAIQFLAVSAKFQKTIPGGNAYIEDQLKRAALSICLNIAEGSGKKDGPDKSRFYSIARGSAMECAAIFDACRALTLGDASLIEDGKPLLVRIVSMLSKMTELKINERAKT